MPTPSHLTRRLLPVAVVALLSLFGATAFATSAVWTPITIARLQIGSAAIYDPVRDRLVEYGGAAETPLDLTRVASLSASQAPWQYLAPSGAPPPVRAEHVGVYDAVRDRMVVFGGQGEGSSPLRDTWALSFSPTPSWTQLPSGPDIPPIWRTSAIYDSARDRMLLFGGATSTSTVYLNQVWSYPFASGTGWALITPSGTPPSARGGAVTVYDPVRDRVLVLGGVGLASFSPMGVFALSLGGSPAWSMVTTTGTPPSARADARGVYDPVGDRVLVFGGYDSSTLLNEVWALSLAGTPAWSKLTPSAPLPSPRVSHQAVWDTPRSRMLVVSGGDMQDGGVWALSTGGSPAWSVIEPDTMTTYSQWPRPFLRVDEGAGRAYLYTVGSVFSLSLDGSQDDVEDLRPIDQWFADAFALDPVRHRAVLMASDKGGVSRTLSLAAPGQTWTSQGSGWGNSTFENTVYDPAADRFVSYKKDGVLQTAPAVTLNWTGLGTTGTAPAPRTQASVVLEPTTRRMWVVGGNASCGCDPGDRIYGLDLSLTPANWISVPVASGPRPSSRTDAGLAWDTHANCLLMFGGSNPIVPDVWALSFSDSARWVQIPTAGTMPARASFATAAYDAANDRLLVFGYNVGEGGNYQRIFALSGLTPVLAVPPAVAPGTLSLAVGPNPTHTGRITLQLSLPAEADVRIELLDVSGRRLLDRTEHRAEGAHEIALQTPNGLAPGVYLVHVRAGNAGSTKRIAVID